MNNGRYCEHGHQLGKCSDCDLADCYRDIERLAVGFERYETARLMNPQQWADAWRLNISTGKPFDEIIDDLRPFLRPNARNHRPEAGERSESGKGPVD